MAELFKKKITLGVVGAGRVGTTLASMFRNTEANVEFVTATSRERALEAVQFIGEGEPLPYQAGKEIAKFPSVSVLLLTPRDDLLPFIAREVAASSDDWNSCVVLHSSGATPVEVLQVFSEKGAHVGILHPCYPICEPMKELPKDGSVTFSFTGEDALFSEVKNFAREWGVNLIRAEGIKREVYHAGLMFSAGHLGALLAEAEDLLRASGLDAKNARATMLSVAGGVLNNLSNDAGVHKTLTGPFARGDKELIAKQREIIQTLSPDARAIYDLLGEQISKRTSK